jgi:cysteine desulfurase
MEPGRVYLDFNATAPLRASARAAALEALDRCGNPSSVHAEGRGAHRMVEAAREQVAALVGADPRNVTFVSGGTEANMLALSPRTGSGRGACQRLLISAIEHPSVLAGGRFAAEAVEKVPVTAEGLIDLATLQHRLAALAAEGVRPLVSLMLANNETGVVQPIAEAARLVHAGGGLLHVDAVQALGRMPFEIKALGADLLTVSGHKIGAPKGVGALIKGTESLQLDPLISGGGQERGARAGTENVPAIAGFGAAAAAAQRDLAADAARMAALRARLEDGLRATSPNVIIFGAASPRLPNTTLFAVAGMKAETAVIAFDLEGVAVSSGSACSSGKVAPSHVLAAMGVAPGLAAGAIRISLGAATSDAEIEVFLKAWEKLAKSLYKAKKQRDIAA